MFTLYHALKNVSPKVVVESGVYNGISTMIIRKIARILKKFL